MPTSPGPAPETAAPPAVSPPVTAAPKAPASSLPPSQDTTFADRAKALKGPLELQKLMDDLKASPVRPAPPTDTAPDGNELPPKSAPAEAPAAEELPPTEETPAEPPAEPPAPETPAEPEGKSLEVPTAKNFRMTLLEGDKVGKLATQYGKLHPDWTLAQAMTAAQAQLEKTGEIPKVAATEPTKPPETTPGAPANSDLPKTVDDVDRAIEAAEKDLAAAADELRMVDGVKIQSKIRQLERHRQTLEKDADRKQQATAAEYDTKFNEAQARAGELYADAANGESAFGKRMREIDDDLQATEDPRFYAPNKPLLIAQMVAAELNIAPRKKGATPAPAKPTTPAAPAKPKSVLPGGASSTTPPSVPQKSAMEQEIMAAKNPHELEKAMAKYGLGSF